MRRLWRCNILDVEVSGDLEGLFEFLKAVTLERGPLCS